MLALLVSGQVPSAHAQTVSSAIAPMTDPVAALAVLKDATADRTTRVQAAQRIIETDSPERCAELIAILSSPASDGSARLVLLETLARTSSPPQCLFETVAGLARTAGNEDLPLIVPALAGFRSRDTARLLIAMLDTARPAPVRQASFVALGRLSGRDDLGSDASAWGAWLDQVSLLSEADWRARLAQDQARRADRLAADLQAARQQLTPVYRRLYGQIPAADRPRLLADMLRDPREEPRALGFQLTALELSSGQTLPAIVAEAATALLTDPAPATRARAALLVDQLARPEAEAAVNEALNRETDPYAAAALLAASARWPSPVARARTLDWLSAGPVARPAAAKAALALVRAGLLDAPAERERAAEALRSVPLDQLGTTELRLLVAIGSDRDRSQIADQMDSSNAAARLASAQSLAGRAEYLDRLLAAAVRDSDLFATAAEAVAGLRPTSDTYAIVATLPAPDLESRRRGLVRIADQMPPSELLRVAQTTDDIEFAASILERRAESAAAIDASQAPSLAQCLERLAEIRLQLGQPDRALAALDLLEAVRSRYPGISAEQAADLRTASQLCLARIDRAAEAGGTPDAWLLGLSLCWREPHAPAIVEVVRASIQNRFSPQQATMFAELASQVAEQEQERLSRLVGPPVPPPQPK